MNVEGVVLLLVLVTGGVSVETGGVGVVVVVEVVVNVKVVVLVLVLVTGGVSVD